MQFLMTSRQQRSPLKVWMGILASNGVGKASPEVISLGLAV